MWLGWLGSVGGGLSGVSGTLAASVGDIDSVGARVRIRRNAMDPQRLPERLEWSGNGLEVLSILVEHGWRWLLSVHGRWRGYRVVAEDG